MYSINFCHNEYTGLSNNNVSMRVEYGKFISKYCGQLKEIRCTQFWQQSGPTMQLSGIGYKTFCHSTGHVAAVNHRSIENHLTQTVTGHACFRNYLHRLRICPSAECPICAGVDEDCYYCLFHCPCFLEEKVFLPSLGVVPEYQ